MAQQLRHKPGGKRNHHELLPLSSTIGTSSHQDLPTRNIVTKSDFDELQKAYKFIPSQQQQPQKTPNQEHNKKEPSNVSSNETTTWQDRMVLKYHSHLYKSHVMADFSEQTNDNPDNIGLRWRVKAEVMNGKGFDTCGNKHCMCYYDECDEGMSLEEHHRYDHDPNSVDNSDSRTFNIIQKKSAMKMKKKKKRVEDVIRWKMNSENRRILYDYEKEVIMEEEKRRESKSEPSKSIINDDFECEHKKELREKERLRNIPHGLGLFDYTVHFQYREHGQIKQELVQLKLCLRCAPKLFCSKDSGVLAALNARRQSSGNKGSDGNHDGDYHYNDNSDYDSDNDSDHSDYKKETQYKPRIRKTSLHDEQQSRYEKYKTEKRRKKEKKRHKKKHRSKF